MKIIYIAGPFRANTAWEVEQNVRRAEELSLEVAMLGAMPLCPHTNTRFFNGLINDTFWLNGTQELLKRCDAIILLKGWDKSAGTLAEISMAKRNNIPVFYDIMDLKCYIKSNIISDYSNTEE